MFLHLNYAASRNLNIIEQALAEVSGLAVFILCNYLDVQLVCVLLFISLLARHVACCTKLPNYEWQ